MMVVASPEPSLLAGAGSTFTVCCEEDLRFPASIARARICCTAKNTESFCSRYAVPRSRAQSVCSLSILSTSGIVASAFTLSSHGFPLSAASRSVPVSLGLAFRKAAASATSCGRSDASRT
jgi:hypothetical protein